MPKFLTLLFCMVIGVIEWQVINVSFTDRSAHRTRIKIFRKTLAGL